MTPNLAHRKGFLLATYAGLRAGESRALRWKDVDLKAGTLTVRLSRSKGFLGTPKSGHERLIPLAGILRRELTTKTKQDPDPLVCLTSQGQPWGAYGLLQSFKRLQARRARRGLALPRPSPLLRDEPLFNTGAPAPAVQKLAGTPTYRRPSATRTRRRRSWPPWWPDLG
jgi:integrase